MTLERRVEGLENSLIKKTEPVTEEQKIRRIVDEIEADPDCAPLIERFRAIRHDHRRQTPEDMLQDPELNELYHQMWDIVQKKHPEMWT